jgi:hypothetical protein
LVDCAVGGDALVGVVGLGGFGAGEVGAADEVLDVGEVKDTFPEDVLERSDDAIVGGGCRRELECMFDRHEWTVSRFTGDVK